MLGVMIHGAIRNTTVSVKMGVRGMCCTWERTKGDQKVSSGCFLRLPSKMSEADNNSTFIEHLLCARSCGVFICTNSFLQYPSG